MPVFVKKDNEGKITRIYAACEFCCERKRSESYYNPDIKDLSAEDYLRLQGWTIIGGENHQPLRVLCPVCTEEVKQYFYKVGKNVKAMCKPPKEKKGEA